MIINATKAKQQHSHWIVKSNNNDCFCSSTNPVAAATAIVSTNTSTSTSKTDNKVCVNIRKTII